MTVAEKSMKGAEAARKHGRTSIQLAALFLIWLALSSCGERTTAASSTSIPVLEQPPTATEVFNLRSECAKLGEKLLGGNVVGLALSKYQVSHYNPKTNRCHVELTVQSADATQELKSMSRYLFDGQTGEMLAYAKLEKGVQTGMAFKKAGIGFEEATKYIDETMKDE